MAKFEIAEGITGRNEGGYANNPADTGGETYAGIARNHWPKWEGWPIIDQIKTTYGKSANIINRQASGNPTLSTMISKFYKQNFWDSLKLDQINDQQLASTVYDFGVNSGTKRAAKFLQEAINNVGSVSIIEDGIIGKITLTHANAISPCLLHTEYNALRRAFYNSIATGNQKQFLRSWLSRLKPYQSA